MSNINPLHELLVDEDSQLNLRELTETIKPYLIINKNSKKVDFLPSFNNLNNQKKILVILAGSKARSLLFNEEEKISPTHIISLQVMPTGSVKSTLKRLLSTKEINCKDSAYFIPNYKINTLAGQLK